MTREENLCNYDVQEQIPQGGSLITLSPEAFKKSQTVLLFGILTYVNLILIFGIIEIRKLTLL